MFFSIQYSYTPAIIRSLLKMRRKSRVSRKKLGKKDKAKIYWGQAVSMGDTAAAEQLNKLK